MVWLTPGERNQLVILLEAIISVIIHGSSPATDPIRMVRREAINTGRGTAMWVCDIRIVLRVFLRILDALDQTLYGQSRVLSRDSCLLPTNRDLLLHCAQQWLLRIVGGRNWSKEGNEREMVVNIVERTVADLTRRNKDYQLHEVSSQSLLANTETNIKTSLGQ